MKQYNFYKSEADPASKRDIFMVRLNMSAGSAHQRLCWLCFAFVTPCIPCSNSNSHLLPTTNIETDSSGMLQLHSLQPGAYECLLMCWALRAARYHIQDLYETRKTLYLPSSFHSFPLCCIYNYLSYSQQCFLLCDASFVPNHN